MKRLSKRLKYLPTIFIVLLGLTPLVWFYQKGDVLITGVDTNFPLDPLVWFERRLFVWNAVANAGADFSSSTAGLFFHLIQVIPFKLGLELQQVQIISLVFWFLLIASSAFLLARIILPKKPLVQMLFVALYSFNIYLFNTWENVKVANLSLVAAIPLALSILLLLREGKLSFRSAAFYSALVGIVASGTGINPSYFIAFFFILFLFLLAEIIVDLGKGSVMARAKDFLFLSIFVVLVNSFWILPTANFVFNNLAPTGSIDKIGFTNWVDSLSENTSILNVMRLQGAWDWYSFDSLTGLPLYIPYALNYFHRTPFLAFSFLLPALALFSLILRKKSKNALYISFGLMFLIGVFLGVGTHLPTGNVFRWFSNHIPFFTLFRSPWYIFTPLVTLSTAGLVSLLFYNLGDRIGDKGYLKRLVVPLSVLTIITGIFFYNYPLVTGKIFRPGRHDGFFINFPDHVFQAQRWLLENNFQGRIIGYPDDEIEQFNWKYRGIESILSLLADVEVLFSPLNAPDSPIADVVKKFYLNLKKGEIETAKRLAAKLNIAFIFEKGDQSSLSPGLPEEIRQLTSTNFGSWAFYQIPENSFQDKIYSPRDFYFGSPYKEGEKFLGLLDKSEALVNPQDSVVNSIPEIAESAGSVILPQNLQAKEKIDFENSPSRLSNRLLSRDLSTVIFEFEADSAASYQPVLERYKLEDFGIEVGGGVEVRVDGEEFLWEAEKISEDYLYFKEISLSKGKHQIALKLENRNLIAGGDFNSGITFKKGGYGEGLGEYKIAEDSSGKYLEILNVGKANVSADFPVLSFNPLTSYYVELKYKQIYGNNGATVVTQGTKSSLVKAQTERLPNYPEWRLFSFFYEPVRTNSTMEINLEAPFTNDPLGTKVLYDDLKAYKVFSNDLFLLKKNEGGLSSPKVTFEKVSPVLYQGEVDGAKGPHVIVFSENYSPQWDLQIEGLNSQVKHFSTNLYANAWYVESTPENYTFEIYYKPQNLFKAGISTSLGTFLLAFLFFLREVKNGRNKNN